MRIRLAILLLFAALAWPQAAGILTHESDTQFILQRGVPPIHSVQPVWSGNQLLSLPIAESRELIIIATPVNGVNEEVRFQMDGWFRLHAIGVWGGYDGSIVLAGFGTKEGGAGASFIGWIAPDHKIRRIAEVDDYTFEAFTVALDGVVWAIAANHEQPPNDTKNLLCRFDPTGKLLTATKVKVPEGVGYGSILIASNNHISWLTEHQYLEFAFDSIENFRAPAPPSGEYSSLFQTHMAVSFGNTIVVSKPMREGNKTATKVYALDKIHKTWYEPEFAKGSPKPTEIYGFDADTLVGTALVKDLGQVLRRYKLSDK